MIDLLDSEILEIEKVLNALSAKQRTSQNLESFRQEILGRFAEIGFIAGVKVYETNQEDVYGFVVDELTRIEDTPFDYERMAHEVTTDILEVLPPSERGETIKSRPEDFHKPEGHKH